MTKIIDFSHEARKYMIIIMKAAAHIYKQWHFKAALQVLQ